MRPWRRRRRARRRRPVPGAFSRARGLPTEGAVPAVEGGDRSTLGFPPAQEGTEAKIAVLDKPMVLVLLNGSALAVEWGARSLPRHRRGLVPVPGGGTAIADVLFGDYKTRAQVAGHVLQVHPSNCRIRRSTHERPTYRHSRASLCTPRIWTELHRFTYRLLAVPKTAVGQAEARVR